VRDQTGGNTLHATASQEPTPRTSLGRCGGWTRVLAAFCVQRTKKRRREAGKESLAGVAGQEVGLGAAEGGLEVLELGGGVAAGPRKGVNGPLPLRRKPLHLAQLRVQRVGPTAGRWHSVEQAVVGTRR